MSNVLQRTIFETPRDAEYFDCTELQRQTGQSSHLFAAVVLKELVDNALDAAETASRAPEVNIDVRRGAGLTIAVSDNGCGMAPDTVARILNYTTRTSDKSVYRSPTRGAQGNALKTVLGIPFALGGQAPVAIESRGVQHAIAARLDLAQRLRIEHTQGTTPTQLGTRVEVTLPAVYQYFFPRDWALGFALFNPHASVKIRESDERIEGAHGEGVSAADFYRPTVSFPDKWRKFLPTDATSPYWYDDQSFERLVFAYVETDKEAGRSRTLRDFVREFRGLTSTRKAKSVCDEFPSIARLADLEQRPDGVRPLLDAMRLHAAEPSHDVLGAVGEEHFRQRLNAAYGVKRIWYDRKRGFTRDGVPFVFEVALAETEECGRVHIGVNHSPSYDDPLASTTLRAGDLVAQGIEGFLQRAHAHPYEGEGVVNTALAAHLICPSLNFLDRGKTRVVGAGMEADIAAALWRVARTLYKEGERQRRGRVRQERESGRARRGLEYTQRDAVFTVLEDAWKHATGDGKYPVSARSLYYAVRPLIQAYTSKEVGYSYFSQTLLPAYQRERTEPLPGVYYEPAGILREPHDGKEVPLGTREVEAYQFPEYRYDKLLYIEKQGLWPMLQASRIAERYDMALVTGRGYATEAARALFERANHNESHQLFVLHDADPAGYNIALTLAEETQRMPSHRVEVIDLGFKLQEALDMGLQTETFTREADLPSRLQLTDLERDYFVGKRVSEKAWRCQRVELNAMTAPQTIEYIERKLQEHGATGKVIPPDSRLLEEAGHVYKDQMLELVVEAIDDLLGFDEIATVLADEYRSRAVLPEPRSYIEEAFTSERELSWKGAVIEGTTKSVAPYADEIREKAQRLAAGKLR